MAKAYSYIRFSSAVQSGGDSLRRQLAAAEFYAKAHNLELDTSSFQDLGVSGFDKSNLEKGALKAFLLAVESGAVPKGSWLLIEKLDRLTRANIQVAHSLLGHLVAAGITVVTLSDGHVYNEAALNDLGSVMISLVQMYRGYEESKTKSERIGAAWAQKRKRAAEGEIMSAMCPSWLKPAADRKSWIKDEPKIKSIRTIVDMALAGHGYQAISATMNRNGDAGFNGKGWQVSTVKRILRNPAIAGVYAKKSKAGGELWPTSEQIENYYPALVTQNEWLKLQAIARPRGEFLKQNKGLDVLSGYLKCSCGAAMRLQNYGRGYSRYVCTNRKRCKTDCPTYSPQEIIDPVLQAITLLQPEQLTDTAGELNAAQASFAKAEKELGRLVDAVTSSEEPIPMLMERMGGRKLFTIKQLRHWRLQNRKP